MLAILQHWLAHALGYMVHEYAHSFTAWLLHFKANPLALDYGHITLDNILFQEDIDENVDYGPIFAAGHGYLAALIAVAGVLIGNGLSYLLSRLLYARAQMKESRVWAMFFFWICVMSVGNFLSYVPVHTFATHADLATTVQGFGVSAWMIAVVLGVPFAIAIWHFLTRMLPDAKVFLFQQEPVSQGVLILLTTDLIFVFFGGSGIRNYGSASHWLSAFSKYVLSPVITVFSLQQSAHRWPIRERLYRS
ncbi:hypothetical protein [Granulicella paludicola]|uniref:hypothetical protein n=1 Tax=Granulicella paludicola TaxID=474951 RepID=UPI0021DFDB9D|nr:hypothetical protein [Granulicella paludicola]